MKVSQRKQAKGRHTSSASSLWLSGSVVIGLVAFLRSDWWRTSVTDFEEDFTTDVDEGDARVGYVRSALFANDGSVHYSSHKLREAFNADNREEALSSLTSARGREKSRFSTTEYWDQRYAKAENSFDWFGTWNSGTALRIKPTVEPWLPTQVSSVLNIGCGNSRLAEELYNDGYGNIMNIDISQVLIDKMRRNFAEHAGLKFKQMDITHMTFADDSFDVIFDKGTLDALYTGDAELVKLAVPHIFRVLKPGGLFVSMSFGSASTRSQLNATGSEDEAPGWASFRTTVVDREGQFFYLYTMTK